tara:strand:+ start:40505 stop:41566 length:1062 start_codon:yes stop_codon:yes gene_type:complete
MKLKWLTRFFILALCLSLVACESLSYYSQAIFGQLSILSKREAIEKLIADDTSSPELKNKLQTVLDIRRFAESELMLPVEDSYGTYVDIKQPYVVWNVFASPEFSIRPVNWCYPIAGCVAYRGYFSEADAQAYANRKSQEGLDVYVGGVSAYSTLGWFSDPLLSTVINRDDYQLAALLFHELAHRLIYIAGDTEFNESFATAMEREGLRRWLLANKVNTADIMQQTEFTLRAREDFVSLVASVADELKTLYARTDHNEIEKRQAKAEVFAQMRRDYANLKNDWNGYDGYDNWMARDLNNAQLSTVTTYYNWVPAIEKILEENNYELSSFYNAIAALTDMSLEQREYLLSSKIN